MTKVGIYPSGFDTSHMIEVELSRDKILKLYESYRKIDPEIEQWCEENLTGMILVGWHKLRFEYPEDAVLFKLRWF